MLSGLRSGTPVYVLFKNEPRLATAKVVSVSNQYPQFGFPQPLNPNTSPVVDLVLEMDGKNETFQRIPLNSSVAEFPDKGIIISETRDGISNEIGVIRSASESALSQIDAHKKIIESCDKLLLDLNPEMRKAQERESEIAELKEQVAAMATQLSTITGILSKSVNSKSKEV